MKRLFFDSKVQQKSPNQHIFVYVFISMYFSLKYIFYAFLCSFSSACKNSHSFNLASLFMQSCRLQTVRGLLSISFTFLLLSPLFYFKMCVELKYRSAERESNLSMNSTFVVGNRSLFELTGWHETCEADWTFNQTLETCLRSVSKTRQIYRILRIKFTAQFYLVLLTFIKRNIYYI